MQTRLLLAGVCCLCACFLSAQNLPNPILFCTQIPNPNGFGSSMETFGNHHASMSAAPRGGDLWIRYPDGTLKNLTLAAGFGQSGLQGATAIAVRDPHVHWDGQKALFSMAVGAPTQQYQVKNFRWQLYEISGLGPNDTPVITLVPNQPADYNNIQPIYGTDDRIIFASDRPRGGYAHLYPQHDEYESSPVVSGFWRLDPKACSMAAGLEMLSHAPSGDFNAIIDHAGRVVFTRWDHLQRDQQADADKMNNGGYNYGTFNYADESANAARLPNTPEIEVFPEPRSSRTDLLSQAQWANTLPQNFNIFNPWTMNEDGSEIEMLNHLGRHELGGNYFTQNFSNDPNLHDFSSVYAPDPDYIRAMHQIQESPVTPGLYFGTDAPEFSTHASGMIVSVMAPPGTRPENVNISHVTHPSTRFASDNPAVTHTGLYRNPLPLSNGQILVMHTSATAEDRNIGTSTAPLSKYAYRLKLLVPHEGTYLKADATPLTGAGISKSVSWWSPDVKVTYSGVLWETYPVEVRPRPRPSNPATVEEIVPAIEQGIFATAGVDLHDFRKFLRRHDLALFVTRDVTSRDDADQQQPFNLKVHGSAHKTVNPSKPNNVYEVKYLQYLQADQLRGIGGTTNPRAGRRPIAQFLHDSLSTTYNPPTNGAQGSQKIFPDGSVAAIVPANRALTWQLTDSTNRGIVRERLWVSAVAGEVRVCTSCHGESTLNQAGQLSPTNPPQALTHILQHLKTFDRDNDGVNDIADAYPTDPQRQIAEPLDEKFIAGLVQWINQNPDNDAAKWTTFPSTTCHAQSAVIDNLATSSIGHTDRLRRFVDLTNMDAATLTFDVAYARFSDTRFDRLRVRVLTCDGTDAIVFQKSGSELATAPDQSSAFTPATCEQWRKESVDLSAYVGKTIEIVFENTGGNGNRLFLDNVNVREQEDSGGGDDPTPPVFSGKETPCKNTVETYVLTSTHPAGSTYFWKITGGTLLSGQGTTSVSVAWGTGSAGEVSVEVGPGTPLAAAKAISLQSPPSVVISADPANGLLQCEDGITLDVPASPNASYQWLLDNAPLSGATSPGLTTNQSGWFKIVATNTAGGCTAEATFFVQANPACNPNFCQSKSTNTSREWIQSVGLAGMLNVSGNNNGYGNFLDALAPLTLPKGVALTFSLSAGYASAIYTERWRVWIDFNKDGDFLDSGETLFSASGQKTVTKNFSIPSTRPNGATRMRIAMKRSGYPTSCETFSGGEVEDYVVIIGSLPAPGGGSGQRLAFSENDMPEGGLKIFPNPASGSVTMAFPELAQPLALEIFNTLGQRVATVPSAAGDSQLRLDLTRFSPGVYFAKMGDWKVERFVVE